MVGIIGTLRHRVVRLCHWHCGEWSASQSVSCVPALKDPFRLFVCLFFVDFFLVVIVFIPIICAVTGYNVRTFIHSLIAFLLQNDLLLDKGDLQKTHDDANDSSTFVRHDETSLVDIVVVVVDEFKEQRQSICRRGSCYSCNGRLFVATKRTTATKSRMLWYCGDCGIERSRGTVRKKTTRKSCKSCRRFVDVRV